MDFNKRRSFRSVGSSKGGGENSRSSTAEEQPILRQQNSPDPSTFTQRLDPYPQPLNVTTTQPPPTAMRRETSHQHREDKPPPSPIPSPSPNQTTTKSTFDFPHIEQPPISLNIPPLNPLNQFATAQHHTHHPASANPSGEILLDMEVDQDDMTRLHTGSRDLRVSFDIPRSSSSSSSSSSLGSSAARNLTPQTQHLRSQEVMRDGDVVRCTSNAVFQKKSTIRSRLQDPSPEDEQRLSGWIGKSGQLRSGLLAKAMEDDEDDPLAGEDMPDEFRNANLNVITFLQWLSLVIIVAALICSLAIPVLKRITLWSLHLWKWEVFLLVLICGRLVSGWGIRCAVFFIERNFLLRKRVLYFVYGLRKAVQNCLWLALVLLAWHTLLDDRVKRETKTELLMYITKTLVCFLVGTLLWLVKTLMVKVLASSFHVSTYFDRIQESVFNQYVIVTLSGPPLAEIQKFEEEEKRVKDEVSKLQVSGGTVGNVNILPTTMMSSIEGSPIAGMQNRKSERINVGGNSMRNKSNRGRSIRVTAAAAATGNKADSGINIDHLHKLNHKNISAWNMKRLMNIVRHGSLATLDEQLRDASHEDESTKQINSEIEAKAAARKIFKNVAREGKRHIHLEDWSRFLREDEALKTMSLFEDSESEKISKSSLKNWLVNAFRERRALALTLNDTKTAVNKLHHMVNVLAAAIILVIWLLILGIATSKFLLFVSSQLLLVAFIFGNTCKTVFESIIFLFIMHPYDVGDRCEIDGLQMLVEEMNILTTVFLRWDSLKVYYPNSVLWQKPISNFYRSPDMDDAIEFYVHIATPPEKIILMKQRILNYLDNKSEHWYPGTKIVIRDMPDINRLKLAFWPTHKINHQDVIEKYTRRSLLLEEMIKIFRELDMQYRLFPIDVNVHSMPTSNRVPPGWATSNIDEAR